MDANTEKSFATQWREQVKNDIRSMMGNPYWDNWKRGRPTKAAKEKRILAHKWNADHDPNIAFIRNLAKEPVMLFPKERIENIIY